MQKAQDIRATSWLSRIRASLRGSAATSPIAVKSWSIYTSIKDLPFRNYKRLTIDDDYSALIIDGMPPAHLLMQTAQDIAEEVAEFLSKGEGAQVLDMVKFIEVTNHKIVRLKTNLICFLRCPNQKYIDMFKEDGFDYPTDDLNDYKMCVYNDICSLELEFEQKKTQYETKYKGKEGKKPTHEYYSDIMAEIRKMEGYAVPDTITTLDFFVYYNRLKKHIDKLKAESNGSRRTGKHPE